MATSSGKRAGSALTLCVNEDLLRHSTVSPVFTRTVVGPKLRPPISTVAAVSAVGGPKAGPVWLHAATAMDAAMVAALSMETLFMALLALVVARRGCAPCA